MGLLVLHGQDGGLHRPGDRHLIPVRVRHVRVLGWERAVDFARLGDRLLAVDEHVGCCSPHHGQLVRELRAAHVVVKVVDLSDHLPPLRAPAQFPAGQRDELNELPRHRRRRPGADPNARHAELGHALLGGLAGDDGEVWILLRAERKDADQCEDESQHTENVDKSIPR